jgi:putative transcriptional regulator
VRRARIFLGYAGWSAAQLEAELEESAWILEQAQPGDVFATDTESLWSEVLRRKGGSYAFVATMPPDPSLN